MNNARKAWIILIALSTMIVWYNTVRACGPWLTFREYLTHSFWSPMFYTFSSLITGAKREHKPPYAGFSTSEVPDSLKNLRDAYQALASSPGERTLDGAREAAARALAPGGLSATNIEEAQLIECKILLREAEGNPDTLAQVRRKLEDFIAIASVPAFAAEARGWLARILYLQRDYVSATKIYLDEVDSAASPLSVDTLASSLRWTYNAGRSQLMERVEELFDTPRHALYMVNLLTNEGSWDYFRRPLAGKFAFKLLGMLKSHPELFKHGTDSNALLMALMRTSLYMGDPASALKYAGAASKSAALQQNVEFNWMTAIARFVRRDYAHAEAPLLRMLRNPSATAADRCTAAQGLLGVYFKTGRPVDALHAAFIQESQPLEDRAALEDIRSPRIQWQFYGLNLDLPYLLDAMLTESHLREYLRKYPKPVGPPIMVGKYDRRLEFSAPQIVRYALAVRLARQEEYPESARIYEDLGMQVRSGRMRHLAELLERSRSTTLPQAERLAALLEYGEYIAANPDRLYFNDLLWWGFQRDAFLDRGNDLPWYRNPRSQPGLTRRERERALANDRALRDGQEERWKAFHVFEEVARKSGDSELGRKAAHNIVNCLSLINTGRFGRREEIRTAIAHWKMQIGNQ